MSIPSERACVTDFSCTSSPWTKIFPVSGLWNPVRIFTSVDFPAPLSPISPSTSPERTWSETSSSAVTTPKLLLMFSTRMASGVATTVRSGAGVAALAHVVPPSSPDWRMRSSVTFSDIDAMIATPRTKSNQYALMPWMREAEVQHGEDEHAERSADDGARSTEERGAADHGRRDRVEHERETALEGLDRVDPHRLEDAGERGQRAAEHEVADLDSADVDAALARSEQVAARGHGMEPPARPSEQDRHHDDHAERPVHRHVGRAPEEPEERVTPWGLDGECTRDVQREPVQGVGHPECGDERGDTDHDGDQPVDEPDE